MFGSKKRKAKRQALLEEEQKAAAARDAERRAERETKLSELLSKAEAGDIQAQNELSKTFWVNHVMNPKFKRQLEANNRRVKVRIEYERTNRAVVQAHAGWLEAIGTENEIDALTGLVHAYRTVKYTENLARLSQETTIRRAEAQLILKRLVRARYDQLLKDARVSYEAFCELRELIRLTHSAHRFGYQAGKSYRPVRDELPVPPLPYPKKWDKLVTHHLDGSPLDQFKALVERRTGDLIVQARRAMHTGELEQMEFVLECCTISVCSSEKLTEARQKLHHRIAEHGHKQGMVSADHTP